MSNDLGTVKVYDSTEDAKQAALDEANAAGVSPSAVMHSAPEGYATGVTQAKMDEDTELIQFIGEGVPVDSEDDADEDAESMTVAEIKDELDARGIEYKSSAKKAELVKLLENAD